MALAKLPKAKQAEFKSIKPDQAPPELPPRLERLWGLYSEWSDGRDDGFSGPAPLTWQGMRDWTEQMGHPLSPLERRLILITDKAWRSEWHRLSELKKPKQ